MMNGAWLILGLGVFLMFWSMDQIVAQYRNLHCFCVVCKLVSATLLLWITKSPYTALLYELSFLPKKRERNKLLLRYGGPALLCLAGAVSALVLFETEQPIRKGFVIAGLVIVVVASEIVVDLLVEKNRALSAQVVQNALGELKVKNLNRELALRSQTAEHNARLEERENIARNIHNVVGHTITSALVSMQAYEVLAETQPERAKDKLNAASDRMHLALEEIRRVVRVMDADTEEIGIADFARLLFTEIEQFVTDTERKVTQNLEEFILSKAAEKNDSETAAAGTAQQNTAGTEGYAAELILEKKNAELLHSVLTECLNNGVRHGSATEFFVYLDADSAHVRLTVQDNGCGFGNRNETEKKICLENGYGLRKIQDYVQKNGGSAEFDGDDGFRVQVMLPLLVQAAEGKEQAAAVEKES